MLRLSVVLARSSVVRAGCAALGAGLMLAGVTACGGGSGSANGNSVTITLYNGQHQQTTEALVAAFERQTGIHVRERDGDETQLAQEIEQEGKNSPADVFYGENSPPLMGLEEKGLLATLPASLVSQIPAQYNSPNNQWVGVSARVSVMVYNTSQLTASSLPTSVLQLADPRWKGKLAIAPTETDFQPIVTAVVKAEGQPAALAWLKAIKANGASHTYPDNETITSDVNSGQAAMSIINHYYWYRLAKEIGQSSMHSKLAFFAPHDPGYVLDVSGAGVLASSKHQAAAQQLLAFLISQTGQQVLTSSDSFEYPLLPGAATPAGVEPPFDQLQPYPITIAELGDGSQALQLLQQAQLF